MSPEQSASFQGFPREAVDFLFSLEFENTVDKLPENKPRYRRLISEPLALLHRDLAPCAQEVSPGIDTKPSRCVSSMYSDMRFSRDRPLKAYLYLRFREPMGGELKDTPGLYFDMGCQYFSYGLRIYKQTAPGMARIRDHILGNQPAYRAALAQAGALGAVLHGKTFARNRYPDIPGPLGDLLNHRDFYVGVEEPLSDVVFSPALQKKLEKAFLQFAGLFRLLREGLATRPQE